jgi:zinc protease
MKKIIIFLCVFIIGSNVFALDYDVYKLNSGQTVIIKEVKNNPIVTIDTWIKTGSINENEQNNGVSHFLEHLFFKGTQIHPPGDFDKILESKGGITNAATSKDFTHYYITIPSKYFDLAMQLHADMLLHPLVPRKELEKERKVVMEEIAKDQNNPSEKVFDNLSDMLYTTHPYKRKVLGTNEIIGKISREDILNYYNTHYAPQNMITIIIGDVEFQHALEKVKEDFKTEPRKIIKNINKKEKLLASKKIKIDYQPVQRGYMLIGYRSTNALNKDTYALDVLATILGDGRSSVFYQIIKEQKQLADSISANNATYKEDGIFAINSNFTPENSDKLQKEIFNQILKIRKNGVTQEQLKIAQNIIERDTYYSRESISNISSEIGYTTILTDNPKYYDEYLKNIKKVTADDIKRVANVYLKENKSAVSIVLPQNFKNKENNIKPNVNHTPKFISENKSTKKYRLDNSATLLITQNNINDIVAISINAKGGEFLEQIPGSAAIVSSVMMKGTKKYSSIELAQVLEENGIKISPSATADDFSIKILTTKSQLQKTLEILNEIVNNATLDSYEIEKTKTTMLNSIKKSRDVPFNIAIEEYKNLIYENSVYSNGSKILEKTIPQIQRENVLQYYQTIFNPENIVISINGNVNTDDIANKFSEIFKNDIKTKFDYKNYVTKIAPLKGPKTSIKKIKDLKTSWLIIGWQTAGVLDEKDCATLQIIDAILGSGMSSRLFKNIRDCEGLAYQLGSSYSPKILKGSFTLYIGTNPQTLNLAKEKMLEEINRMKIEFVSDKELQEAKDKIIGHYIISQETNLDKASTVGWFETSGRGFDFTDKYENIIQSITASDIIEVANKYFNKNYVTSIVD